MKSIISGLCVLLLGVGIGLTCGDRVRAAIVLKMGDAGGGPAPSIQVGFSPNEGAEQAVLDTINSARLSLRLAGYSLTSKEVVAALVAAKRRGVDVGVVVDYKENIEEDRSGKARAALNDIAGAGIPLRTVKVFPIHHDKFIVVDADSVETGSFNYSEAAAHRNSENAIVIWHEQSLAKAFLKHWERNWDAGVDYKMNY